MGSGLVGVFEMSDLTVHLCTLHLHGFDLTLEIGLVATLVSALVTLCNCILSQTASLKILFVKKAFCASALIVQA